VTVECTDPTDPPNTGGNATASDTCGDATVSHSDTFATDCGDAGTITRTWTATDECENSATCIQTITIEDTTPPNITCPANVTYGCDQIINIPAAAPDDVTATDDCGTVTKELEECCHDANGITRTYNATDDCGNTATCTQTITICCGKGCADGASIGGGASSEVASFSIANPPWEELEANTGAASIKVEGADAKEEVPWETTLTMKDKPNSGYTFAAVSAWALIVPMMMLLSQLFL
jgi:hypothetical protein